MVLPKPHVKMHTLDIAPLRSESVEKGTGPNSRTPALMGNYGTDTVFNEE